MKRISVAIAIIVRSGRLLIAQRNPDATFPNHWELPGGKCEPGETIESCLHREIKEEIDAEIEILRPLEPMHHNYPHANLSIHPFICRLTAGDPRPIACRQIRWIDPLDLANYQFPPANESLIRDLMVKPLPASA
jgi:mutator protein MutT